MDLLKMHQAIAPETDSAARDATFMDIDNEMPAMDAETVDRILEVSPFLTLGHLTSHVHIGTFFVAMPCNRCRIYMVCPRIPAV